MNRRNFLRTIGFAGTAALLPKALLGKPRKTVSPTNRKMNIVFIMADDVSPEMFSCYGLRKTRTPNINRIATDGVMFRTAWASAICAPSRALVMTGRYGNTSGVYHNGLWLGKSRRLLEQNLSFGRLLKDAGYATAIAGKWHCGANMPYSKHGGFDEYCLWEGSREIDKLPGKSKYKAMYNGDGDHPRFWQPSIVQNHKLVKTGANDFGPDIFTNFICDFIERSKDKPFLAYYPMVAPHGTRDGVTTTPLRGRVGEMGKPATAEEADARFVALNEYIDLLVGRIIKKVTDLGLADRTLIIFCGDNGTAVTAKSRGVERGCHVPFVVCGPGVKKRGATDELMDFSDLLPTFCDYAGATLPEKYHIDGKSLKPFLTGVSETHRDWIYSCIAATQLVRTKQYMLEVVNPILSMPQGRFYFCGDNRFGKGYKLVSNSPEHAKARKEFAAILSKYPALLENHPHFKTKKGKRWLDAYREPDAVKKHLHNHKNYRFYEE
ncbi:MAG: sulfatase-like hydrolase/transferase [Phycisphaerae bacterium]|jgi:arylsulfatase A-like enzyme|nr:sulfatase-like hydrolase/transferase [Phycisphaerae bacterium]